MEVGSHGKCAVVLYFSRFGKPRQTHHKVVLDLDAKAIARIEDYKFGGPHDPEHNHFGPLFFVPDDTLLLDEAACLGIRSPSDLYGGVVPHLFVKTKAITHGLVDRDAERPPGWSTTFAERIREIVLPGYTVFSNRDAHMAARRLLSRGPIRVKKPLSASGKDQTVVTTLNELDAVLEKVGADEMATYGLVLEENLCQVRTFSVGEVAVGGLAAALGAEFTHEGDKCTFEVLMERAALKDPALRAIAEIIHDIDLKDSKFGRTEVAGIRTLIEGISVATKDDSERIARGSEVFNDLYEYFRKKRR